MFSCSLFVLCSLKQFYASSSNLQYFKNLIKVPSLPDVCVICFVVGLTVFFAQFNKFCDLTGVNVGNLEQIQDLGITQLFVLIALILLPILAKDILCICSHVISVL